MTLRLARLSSGVALATVLLLGPPRADAAVLLPGASVAPDILMGAAGVLVDSTTVSLTGVGSLTAAVIRNVSNTLDFYYQIVNNAGSGHNLDRNSNGPFVDSGFEFATDVFYRIDTGGLGIFSSGSLGAAPSSADRGANGVIVGFNFSGLGTIDPGETSRILVIRTNATDYVPGLSIVDNGVFAGGVTFAPAAAVPEPASLALLSSAFAAAGYLARRRKSKKDQTAQPV